VDPAEITWDPLQPKHGDVVSISVTVENRGVVMAERFEVDIRRGSQVIGLQVGSNLPAGEKETLSIIWDASKGGNNSMMVTLDPKRLVDELDENNNEVRFYIEVERPPAEDEKSTLPYVMVVVVIVIVLVLVGFFKWKLMNIREETVDVIVDGEDMYTGDAQSGTSTGLPPEGGPPQGGGGSSGPGGPQ
jgi:subtilase family serine protease